MAAELADAGERLDRFLARRLGDISSGTAPHETDGPGLPLSRARLNEVIQQAFLTAGAHAAKPGVAELIRRAAER